MPECSTAVVAYVRRDGTAVVVKCGTWHNGEEHYCPACESKLAKLYPQGWTAYPGDICKHGTYTGGCGVDHICPQCENGD
jgi:hypothetical protein